MEQIDSLDNKIMDIICTLVKRNEDLSQKYQDKCIAFEKLSYEHSLLVTGTKFKVMNISMKPQY
jgi:hypothetical protein